jgi:MGT family glycosyltransferase
MAKALFLSLPAHGHTNPTLPLVQELVARGDVVVYYSSASFQSAVTATGASFRAYRNGFLSDMRGIPGRMDELVWLFTRTADELLADHLDEWRAESADYVITDSLAPWGQWAGEILGIPVVTSVSTFAFNRKVLAFGVGKGVRPSSPGMLVSKLRHMIKAARRSRTMRRRYRVKGPGLFGTMFGRSGLNIVYTSRYFQPCADTFDDSYLFAGPSMRPHDGAAERPRETPQPPLVYVSLGTIFNADTSFYRACLRAFESFQGQVLMSVGHDVAIDALGPVPAHVTIRPHVPQLEVLQRASVFVTHGGMNSVSESLFYGVPLVVIPQMGEQAIVGRRVEELGAGLYLAKADVTSQLLRDNVRRVLSEDVFGQKAGLVRDSFLRAGGVARAAAAIQEWVRRRHAR